jgi:hypothetical protein
VLEEGYNTQLREKEEKLNEVQQKMALHRLQCVMVLELWPTQFCAPEVPEEPGKGRKGNDGPEYQCRLGDHTNATGWALNVVWKGNESN